MPCNFLLISIYSSRSTNILAYNPYRLMCWEILAWHTYTCRLHQIQRMLLDAKISKNKLSHNGIPSEYLRVCVRLHVDTFMLCETLISSQLLCCELLMGWEFYEQIGKGIRVTGNRIQCDKVFEFSLIRKPISKISHRWLSHVLIQMRRCACFCIFDCYSK